MMINEIVSTLTEGLIHGHIEANDLFATVGVQQPLKSKLQTLLDKARTQDAVAQSQFKLLLGNYFLESHALEEERGEKENALKETAFDISMDLSTDAAADAVFSNTPVAAISSHIPIFGVALFAYDKYHYEKNIPQLTSSLETLVRQVEQDCKVKHGLYALLSNTYEKRLENTTDPKERLKIINEWQQYHNYFSDYIMQSQQNMSILGAKIQEANSQDRFKNARLMIDYAAAGLHMIGPVGSALSGVLTGANAVIGGASLSYTANSAKYNHMVLPESEIKIQNTQDLLHGLDIIRYIDGAEVEFSPPAITSAGKPITSSMIPQEKFAIDHFAATVAKEVAQTKPPYIACNLPLYEFSTPTATNPNNTVTPLEARIRTIESEQKQLQRAYNWYNALAKEVQEAFPPHKSPILANLSLIEHELKERSASIDHQLAQVGHLLEQNNVSSDVKAVADRIKFFQSLSHEQAKKLHDRVEASKQSYYYQFANGNPNPKFEQEKVNDDTKQAKVNDDTKQAKENDNTEQAKENDNTEQAKEIDDTEQAKKKEEDIKKAKEKEEDIKQTKKNYVAWQKNNTLFQLDSMQALLNACDKMGNNRHIDNMPHLLQQVQNQIKSMGDLLSPEEKAIFDGKLRDCVERTLAVDEARIAGLIELNKTNPGVFDTTELRRELLEMKKKLSSYPIVDIKTGYLLDKINTTLSNMDQHKIEEGLTELSPIKTDRLSNQHTMILTPSRLEFGLSKREDQQASVKAAIDRVLKTDTNVKEIQILPLQPFNREAWLATRGDEKKLADAIEGLKTEIQWVNVLCSQKNQERLQTTVDSKIQISNLDTLKAYYKRQIEFISKQLEQREKVLSQRYDKTYAGHRSLESGGIRNRLAKLGSVLTNATRSSTIGKKLMHNAETELAKCKEAFGMLENYIKLVNFATPGQAPKPHSEAHDNMQSRASVHPEPAPHQNPKLEKDFLRMKEALEHLEEEKISSQTESKLSENSTPLEQAHHENLTATENESLEYKERLNQVERQFGLKPAVTTQNTDKPKVDENEEDDDGEGDMETLHH